MITPGYGLTSTERVLPRMALDFTTAALDSRVTVTRALNTATRINSSGYVEVVNANLPRFDFASTGTGVCNGLLIEESRANVLPYSENFSDATWIKSNASTPGPAVTAPDNTLSAYPLVEDSAASNHIVLKQFGVYGAGTYTYSIFVKANGRTQLRLAQTVTTNYSVDYDLTAVTATTSAGGATGTIRAFPNGYYRCTMTFTTTTSINLSFVIYMMSAGATNYQGNGTSGLIPWGGQVEVGAFATSYIPNLATGTTTRNADEVRMTGTNFSSWYNASEGAFFVQANLFSGAYPNNANIISVVDTTLSDTLRFWVWSGAANNLRWTETEGGAQQFDLTRTYTANTSFKAVATYKANSFAFALNGGALTSSSSGLVITSADGLIIGSKTGFTEFMSGHIAKVMYWPQRITNAEIQAFSK